MLRQPARKYFMKIAYLLSFGVFLLSGCGFYNEKNPGDPATVPASVSYGQVSAEVFQRRCNLCHSAGGAGFDSSNYAAIVSMIGQVQEQAIAKQSMPPDSPLTPYEQKVLTNWINSGMPQ